jgi:hypothetical protein
LEWKPGSLSPREPNRQHQRTLRCRQVIDMPLGHRAGWRRGGRATTRGAPAATERLARPTRMPTPTANCECDKRPGLATCLTCGCVRQLVMTRPCPSRRGPVPARRSPRRVGALPSRDSSQNQCGNGVKRVSDDHVHQFEVLPPHTLSWRSKSSAK